MSITNSVVEIVEVSFDKLENTIQASGLQSWLGSGSLV